MKLRDKLRAIGIINTHDLLRRFGGPQDVAVGFTGAGRGRGGRSAYSRVYSPTFKTDPKSHWHDYGHKTIHGPRDESMPEALAWATATYGITEWATDPTDANNKVPRKARDAAIAAANATHPNAGESDNGN